MHTLLIAAVAVLSLPLLVLGQAVPPPPELDVMALLQLVTQMADALKRGETTLAVVFLSIGITQVLRVYGGRIWPQLKTDRASYILAFAVGIGTELSVSLGMGAPLSLMTIGNALIGAFASIGAHQAKKLKAQAAAAGTDEAAKVDSPQAAVDVMNGNSPLPGPGPQP